MYEKYYNLVRKPFELVPNPEFLYLSRTHRKALTYINYGIKEKVGFVLLTGEVGCGKTTLVRNFIKESEGTVTLASIFNTKVTFEQMISMINHDYGLEVEGKNKATLVRELNQFLVEQYSKGNQTVLVIDEAQNLGIELLEEIRMLSNLETDSSKLIQILLVGQPELKDLLCGPELRQLRQRISISCHLYPLTREETGVYILHRLEVAGNKQAIKIGSDVIDAVYAFSRGVPRLINIVCDFLLLTAFIERVKEVSRDMTEEIIDDLQLENKYWPDYGTEHAKMFEAPEEDADISDCALKKNGSQIEEKLERMKSKLGAAMKPFYSEIASMSEKIELLQKEVEKMCEEGNDLSASLRKRDKTG